MCFGIHDSAFSEVLQKGQQPVWGSVSAWLGMERLGSGERLLFEREVCMEINLGRLDGLMAEP